MIAQACSGGRPTEKDNIADEPKHAFTNSVCIQLGTWLMPIRDCFR